MSEMFSNNKTELYNYKLLNNTINHRNLSNPFKTIGYFFLILVLIFFIFIFVAILILLIRRQILKYKEKIRRIKLKNEINKIMMLDIFDTRSPTIDTHNKDFHSISNDSTLSDTSSNSSGNVLSEINVHNDAPNSKE